MIKKTRQIIYATVQCPKCQVVTYTYWYSDDKEWRIFKCRGCKKYTGRTELTYIHKCLGGLTISENPSPLQKRQSQYIYGEI